jgi:endonuclease YncB( thermonuclease family)
LYDPGMSDAKACGKGHRGPARFFAGIVLLLAHAGLPAASADFPADGTTVLVAEAVDGSTLRLADGRLVRLAGVQPPQPRFGSGSGPANAPAELARDELAGLAAGRPVVLHAADPALDRYGRTLADAVRHDGVWLQEALVSAGAALVVPLPGMEVARARTLLAAEEEARQAGRGLWAEPAFRVRSPSGAAQAVGGFGIVEGVVADTAEVRGRVYLNFGEDWREDFTISVAPGDRDAFEEAGIDLLALAGRTVRARGWLRDFNGPLIDARHPAQIELPGGPR